MHKARLMLSQEIHIVSVQFEIVQVPNFGSNIAFVEMPFARI